MNGRMDGEGFTPVIARNLFVNKQQLTPTSCLRQFISQANGVHTRNYSFRADIIEDIFEIRSCIEILANDIEIYTIVQYMFYS